MISNYKTNKQKYEKMIEYTNNYPNISDDTKKDIVQIMQKYKMCIFCMEENEVYDLVEKCAKHGSNIPLKNQLNYIIFGESSDFLEEYNDDREEELYNM